MEHVDAEPACAVPRASRLCAQSTVPSTPDRSPPEPSAGYPEGWFAVAFSHQLRPGRVVSARLAGRPVVVWRDAENRVLVSGAYCPHLGAHLGHGGRVVDGLLRCPFHGFRFDGSGACVDTPSGAPPPSGRLQMMRTREVNGMVLVHAPAADAPAGEAPGWEVEGLPDDGEWLPNRTRTWRVRCHLHDIAEHAVDTNHLWAMHLLGRLTEVQPVRFEGPRLRTAYDAVQFLPRPFPSRGLVRARFSINAEGLGFIVGDVQVRTPWYSPVVRLVMAATPVTPHSVDLRVSARLRRTSPCGAARLLTPAVRVADRVAARIAIFLFAREVGAEVRIWEHKAYLDDPSLIEPDAGIRAHRAWSRQFYSRGR
ncbi:Rieske 2Fe-2S domain-containing protein [Actinomadura sp. 9N215]|uniref:Rieske 2Fe-2S domain-containing protein n=1 Tax=Actinomadura sp. 9N215 TaxID=3375150 RepID=UPI0037B44F3F